MRTKTSNAVPLAVLIILLLAAVRAAQVIVLPFLLALFIAIIASAPVEWMRSRRVPMPVAVGIVAAAIILVLAGAILLVAGPVDDFSGKMPSYLDGLQRSTQQLTDWLTRKGLVAPEKEFRDVLNPGSVMRLVNTLLNSVTQLLRNIFLITFTAILMLLEASIFSEKMRIIRRDSGTALTDLSRILKTNQRYMSLKALSSLATGILISIGMLVLGVDYAVLWGFAAFLLNFIPTIGSIIAAVPAVLLAWLQLGYHAAIYTAVYFLAVNILIGTIIEPRLMGRGMGLSTLVVFLSLVFWGWLLGPIGMLLSVPLTMLVKFGAEARENTRWIAILLSKSPKEYE